ncbi:MAG: deaminase domain-containing protein [Acidobacteriota bacterium]
MHSLGQIMSRRFTHRPSFGGISSLLSRRRRQNNTGHQFFSGMNRRGYASMIDDEDGAPGPPHHHGQEELSVQSSSSTQEASEQHDPIPPVESVAHGHGSRSAKDNSELFRDSLTTEQLRDHLNVFHEVHAEREHLKLNPKFDETNLASAYFDLDDGGPGIGPLYSISGKKKPPGTVGLEGKNHPRALPYSNARGYDRSNDAELKMLEHIHRAGILKGRKGQIRISSELAICESCRGAIEAFKKKYPDIEVVTRHGPYESMRIHRIHYERDMARVAAMKDK